MMRGGQTPLDTSRLVALDTLIGNRGPDGERAVRLRELPNFLSQSFDYALKNRSDPKSSVDVIAANIAMPAADNWVSGPSITLGKGVWSVSGSALFKTGAAGIIAMRLFDGSSGILSTQASHPAGTDYYTQMHLSGVITIAAATTLTLQAAPSIASGTISMIAKTTIGGPLDATRLSAVQIGA